MSISRHGFLGISTIALLLLLSAAPQTNATAQESKPAESAATAAPKCDGLPPGKHALLERMTAAFGLTCEQQLKVEPLLHDEESVSKPLLSFTAFSPEEKKAMMLTIKVAARKQIKPLLTADQQKKMDDEIESVAKGGGRSGGGKNPAKVVDSFESEEALCDALARYSALTDQQKNEMILQVKKAARREGSPELTAEQQKKIDADIRKLSGQSDAKGK
jgi:hypothetical protein